MLFPLQYRAYWAESTLLVAAFLGQIELMEWEISPATFTCWVPLIALSRCYHIGPATSWWPLLLKPWRHLSEWFMKTRRPWILIDFIRLVGVRLMLLSKRWPRSCRYLAAIVSSIRALTNSLFAFRSSWHLRFRDKIAKCATTKQPIAKIVLINPLR